MNRFRNVLFVADEAGNQTAALAQAAELAKANSARLTLMDVVEPMVWSAANQARFGADLSNILRNQRQVELAELAKRFSNKGFKPETRVAIGRPFMEIIRAGLKYRHDLLIKNAEFQSDTTSASLGPNDLHLLRKYPGAVWIDRGHTRPPYRTILAAVDPLGDADPSISRRILELALSFKARENARVHIAHAWHLPGEQSLQEGRIGLSDNQITALLTEQRNRHAQALGELLGEFDMNLDDPNVHFEKDNAAALVVRLAQKLPADLLVTATVGRTGIPGFFIGNNAESLIQRVEKPVLTIKPSGFICPLAN